MKYTLSISTDNVFMLVLGYFYDAPGFLLGDSLKDEQGLPPETALRSSLTQVIAVAMVLISHHQAQPLEELLTLASTFLDSPAIKFLQVSSSRVSWSWEKLSCLNFDGA